MTRTPPRSSPGRIACARARVGPANKNTSAMVDVLSQARADSSRIAHVALEAGDDHLDDVYRIIRWGEHDAQHAPDTARGEPLDEELQRLGDAGDLVGRQRAEVDRFPCA